MKKQLKVLFGLFILLIIGVVCILSAETVLSAVLENQGIPSLIILVIFFVLIFFNRSMSDSATRTTVTAFITSIVGTVFDTWGNFIYNKPLEWLLSPWGKMNLVHDIYKSYNRFSTRTTLEIIDAAGKTHMPPSYILYGYRFIQYLVLLLIVGHLIRKIPYKKEPEKKADPLSVSDEELQEVFRLLKEGKQEEAVDIVRDKTNVTVETKTIYAEKKKSESEDR